MKKVMLIFGTRPEAIKMCPLVLEMRKHPELETVVCVTGQHRQMLDQILECFHVEPKYDLSIMQKNQTLFDVTVNILIRVKEVLENEKPDVVLVHGDTSTAFVTALACFYLQIPVGHVEAGLRTYNLYSPFPEEFNRQAVDLISQYYFAPTETSRQNLLKEGKPDEKIFVTGNTVIDALATTVRHDYQHPEIEWAKGSRLLLLTAHRRENLGEPMREMFTAIRRIVDEFPDVKVIYPMHLNPVVREMARACFAGEERVHLIEPLDVLDFHNLMAHSYLILTDSGGIQEEAPRTRQAGAGHAGYHRAPGGRSGGHPASGWHGRAADLRRRSGASDRPRRLPPDGARRQPLRRRQSQPIHLRHPQQGVTPCTPELRAMGAQGSRTTCGLAGVLPPWHDGCHGSPVWCGFLAS